MTQEEFDVILEERRNKGYTVVMANDAIGSGALCFVSRTHDNVPSPISFTFLRLLNNGELKQVGFNLSTGSWYQVLSAAMKDILG